MKNLVASVQDRLRNLARSRGESFQQLLIQFARERWLHRLSQSPHATAFSVKGAALLHAWAGGTLPYRSTKDLDLKGTGEPSERRMGSLIAAVAVEPVEPDGIDFDPATVQASAIRAEMPYGGVHVDVRGRLGKMQLRLPIDIGFGDAVTGGPVRTRFPALLSGLPTPEVWTYNESTVIAEKTAAITDLGWENTRMKDFFDLRWLAQHRPLDGVELVHALQRTFATRKISLPGTLPDGLTDDFGKDPVKQRQWEAWRRKLKLHRTPVRLLEVIRSTRRMLEPVLCATLGAEIPHRWVPGEGWVWLTEEEAESCL